MGQYAEPVLRWIESFLSVNVSYYLRMKGIKAVAYTRANPASNPKSRGDNPTELQTA